MSASGSLRLEIGERDAALAALIKQVATIQVCRWYMRAKEGFMDQGAWMYARELDPDVKVMLGTMRVSPM